MGDLMQVGVGRLKVYVAKPSARYDRRRFDWTGFIPSIELDGHQFAISETLPGQSGGTGGEGLCNEFKADDASMGWDDKDALFLKPGVGLLRREGDKPYHFAVDYPLEKAFPCTWEARAESLDFHLEPIAHKGIAYREDKHIAVIDNMILITTTMENVGQRSLHLKEYNHNFLSMDGLGAHAQSSLTLHGPYAQQHVEPGVVELENRITFTDAFKTSFMIYCDKAVEYSPKRWEIRDEKAGLAMEEWGDFPVAQYMAWGMRHVISPEIFISMDLEPGQARTWTRLWKLIEL